MASICQVTQRISKILFFMLLLELGTFCNEFQKSVCVKRHSPDITLVSRGPGKAGEVSSTAVAMWLLSKLSAADKR